MKSPRISASKPRTPRFAIDAGTGRPVERAGKIKTRVGKRRASGSSMRGGGQGQGQQVLNDPYSGVPYTINVFAPQSSGGNYPTGSFTPQPDPVTVTDRTKANIAEQVGSI